MNEDKIPAPDIKVAIAEKRLTKIKINRILVTLFLKNPLIEVVSSVISSKSFTFGFLSVASTSAANKPDDKRGLSDVIGAAINATTIVKG